MGHRRKAVGLADNRHGCVTGRFGRSRRMREIKQQAVHRIIRLVQKAVRFQADRMIAGGCMGNGRVVVL